MCSTARRHGFRTAASPTSTPSSRAPARRRARAAYPLSSSGPIRRGSRSPSASTSSRRIRWRAFAFAIAACRRRPSRRGGRRVQDRDAHARIFRPSVAAAAIGFARRALDEAVAHAKSRRMFGGALADLQLTQAKLGEMATMIDAAALLTYRAAWRRDVQKLPATREAAMAKMTATENAQWVIDQAVQIVWRPRRSRRRNRRAALSRNPRAAHLRRRHRSAEADRRPGGSEEPIAGLIRPPY